MDENNNKFLGTPTFSWPPAGTAAGQPTGLKIIDCPGSVPAASFPTFPSYAFAPPPVDARIGTQPMNDTVAVEPFPKSSEPTQVTKSGFTRDTRKCTLAALKVVFGNEHFPVGSTVYVRADQQVQQWAKDVYELDGHPFILIPKTAVLIRAYNPYAYVGTVFTGTVGTGG